MQARMTNPAYLVPDAGQAIQALMQAMQLDMEQGIVPAATLMLAGMRSSRSTAAAPACTQTQPKPGRPESPTTR